MNLNKATIEYFPEHWVWRKGGMCYCKKYISWHLKEGFSESCATLFTFGHFKT